MIKDVVLALFKPVSDIFKAREARKAARESAQAKLQQMKQSDQQQLELNKDEWEALQVKGMDRTWKDEYITVSTYSIFNLIVLGGILAAFGHPQVLEGVGIAIQALMLAGVDVGLLLTATAFAGLGLSIWKLR